jgi:hypothetical protein
MNEGLAFGWMIKSKERARKQTDNGKTRGIFTNIQEEKTVCHKHLQRSEFGLIALKAHQPSQITYHRLSGYGG